MAKDNARVGNGILGDIDPAPEPDVPQSGEPVRDKNEDEPEKPATGSSGGTVDTGTGGTRNYRSGTGAAGSDIGSRPE